MLTENHEAPLILIVEDDDNHAELIQRSLEGAYRLVVAGSLHAARLAIEQNRPGLVLTDYRLPDGDGQELVVFVNDCCPVVMMTSQGNEQLAVEAMKAGVQDYIVKSPEIFTSMPRVVGLALREWALVSERRKIQEAISRGKREWEQTFDAVPDLIAIIDTKHTISRVNRAMAERCGLRPEDLPGLKCFDVVHGLTAPPADCPYVRMMQCGREQNQEMEEKRLAGFFDVTISPLYDADKRIIACVHVARDISDRKRAEEERRELELKFLQTQKLESLGVLAGGIAHDFNNILTIILGHCYVANGEIDPEMSYRAHMLKIEAAANRAADLCQQMLTYAGKSMLVQTRVNLWLLVEDIVKLLQSAINKNVKVDLCLNRDVPEINGDVSQIQQIVMNLIINAAEAIGANNGTIRVSLDKIRVAEGSFDTCYLGDPIVAGSYALLQVSDDGCGMDQETQQRIFEPFFTTKFTGRGLGMSAVLGIIKSHNGLISISSQVGAGATFKVYFPLQNSVEAAEERQPSNSEPLACSDMTVLLVDDEEEVLKIGTLLLGAMGFSVISASNGREALNKYRSAGEEISLIMLDLIMPEMGGLETYHELRKLSAAIPIIMASGYGMEQAIEGIGNDPLVSAINKPYNPNQLKSLLIKLLDTAR